jgi:pimeloyl-ACP methyl ester carboxylesterase
MTASPVLLHQVWPEPDGIAPRGTLIVLGAPGETPAVYRRFADRLAADAYRVIVLDHGPDRRAAAHRLLTEAFHPAPRVLVGFDRGAREAIRITRHDATHLDAVILAGLPTAAGSIPRRDPAETFDGLDDLDAHTACPRHRAVLVRETRADGTSNAAPEPDDGSAEGLFDKGSAGALPVPVLAIHGESDALSPAAAAVAEYRRLGATQVVTVAGGRHDILNDVTHRSVAATVVLFLERLRNGDVSAPLIRDATADADRGAS